MKTRLDTELHRRGLTISRSQAENWIRLGKVMVDDSIIMKPGHLVDEGNSVVLLSDEQYVSRAGLKLSSVADILHISFKDKVVLDVGSSTGGFTDYALQHGAKKVIAVDVGTDQLHPSLRGNPAIELHEKTDIRKFKLAPPKPDIIVIDVSFISLREILPYIARELSDSETSIVAMLKPQFEAGRRQSNKGVVKNATIRRQIIKDFEVWSKQFFVIKNKHDSGVKGMKGNQERFYLLRVVQSLKH